MSVPLQFRIPALLLWLSSAGFGLPCLQAIGNLLTARLSATACQQPFRCCLDGTANPPSSQLLTALPAALRATSVGGDPHHPHRDWP